MGVSLARAVHISAPDAGTRAKKGPGPYGPTLARALCSDVEESMSLATQVELSGAELKLLQSLLFQ